ncbi:MAG: histidine phosphatase family protein [Actinomycetota bacterium]
MTRIYLVRHGATQWNIDKRAQGTADIPLTPKGMEEAQIAREALANIPMEAVYSSDLVRAVETARPIAAAHGLEVDTDPDFREIDQGEWTGLTVEEIRERWPDRWGPARHYSPRPGGEAPDDVRRRALAGLKRVVEAHPDGDVVIVSHGGTIRWICAEALGYDAHRSARIRGLGNGGIVSIEAKMSDGLLVLGNLTRLDGNTPDLDDPND